MYAFVKAIEDENHILVRPFGDEEIISLEADDEQIEIIQQFLSENREEPIMVFYDEDEFVLEEVMENVC